MHRLVIAEKPSVAMSIAKVLGATARKDGHMEGCGWLVSWCVGHVSPFPILLYRISLAQTLVNTGSCFSISHPARERINVGIRGTPHPCKKSCSALC